MAGLVIGVAFLDRVDGLVSRAHYLVTGQRRGDAANPGETLPSRTPASSPCEVVQ